MNYVKIEKNEEQNDFEVSRLSMENGIYELETVSVNSYGAYEFLALSKEKYGDFENAVQHDFTSGNYDSEELDADEVEEYTPMPLFDLIEKAGLFEDEPKTPNEMRIKALQFVKDQEVDINVYNADDESLYELDEEYLEELKRDFPRINYDEPFIIVDRIGGPIFDILQASDVHDFRYLVEIANMK
ncbi:hypothetical protein [Staphylococcus pseudintermedius]|uniref:hypothetical protein n=1 Tax=Staphylococcus pseudintermedius TaxID=283734 RepID=UPI00193484E3|nr:hypothetical protein [Staphylococcus pseudintermedius]MBM0384883.1 hypothetical protein [Staphylococcus pseudintermedius]